MNDHQDPSVCHIVVMGVSGSGKTTVAEILQQRTGWEYAEADDFHPQANIDKMSRGEPLNDADRQPWLEALRDWMIERQREGRSSITTCSALKRSYREILCGAGDVTFVLLHGPYETLKERMGVRKGHFMPLTLLQSQLDTLELLEEDEPGFTVSIETPPEQIVDEILARVRH
ncbi:gluconokinase [Mobilicoccus massiliensis]|uniref:gluconokinase n=1 Tax=Mobilicoccus massiliensis TaxID=1522310 RepID=UPI00058EDFD2|nr:gluconokinase [Mobilicoccus massiliensis]